MKIITYIFLVCISWWFLFVFIAATAANIISNTHFLRDPETLASSNGDFMIGFFSPTNNSTNRYVGIWYTDKQESESESGTSEVVWVANRDNPLKNSSDGVLRISEDGNLRVLDGQNNSIWSTNISISQTQANDSVEARLLDTGNLVLFSNASGETIWQSFDHLTHTMLPPVTVTIDMNSDDSSVLCSWKSASDPSSGHFSVVSLPRNLPEFFIMEGDRPYWRSGPWNGNIFLGIPLMNPQVSNGFQINNIVQGKLELSYSMENPSLPERFVINHDGRFIKEDWDESKEKWEVVWNSLESECDVYGKCGEFGSCDPKNSPICKCLKGFEPNNKGEWSKGNWTSGCFRKTPLQCNTSIGKSDKFMRMKYMKVPDYAYWLSSGGQDDCKRKCLQNCSCLGFAYYLGIGCMVWNTSLVDIQQFSGVGANIFIRLASSELGETKQKIIITTISAILGGIILIVFMYYGWKLLRQRYGLKITNKEYPFHNLLDDRMDQIQIQDLPLFKFEVLKVATNLFSIENMIGRGGFGIVYKGKLEDGREIAVKRLSRGSGQGLQEFMNEVIVISKLQHKNLVRLFGCCVEKEEKLLVYEYMPNKSLDAILFDPHLRKDLNWRKRYIIVEGICRGMLYLHRDSRLKIIHRDLKASNILLDEELNPKISDFGMARIFGSKQDQANTLRVVGTYGYMSPEYAMEGRFSEKSDVFGLGVLLLEIVSGKRNNNRFSDYESLSLLSYAWKLWNENDILTLVDPTLDYDNYFRVQVLKCIQLGLLCVQEYPEDRPTISTLVYMLDVDDVTDLPRPTKPGFTQRKLFSTDDQYGEEHGSINLVSDLTILDGR